MGGGFGVSSFGRVVVLFIRINRMHFAVLHRYCIERNAIWSRCEGLICKTLVSRLRCLRSWLLICLELWLRAIIHWYNKWLYLHFWYLNFVCIVLPSEIMPWPGASRWLAADWCGRTAGVRMQTHPLNGIHRNGNSTICVQYGGRLTQFGVIERLHIYRTRRKEPN